VPESGKNSDATVTIGKGWRSNVFKRYRIKIADRVPAQILFDLVENRDRLILDENAMPRLQGSLVAARPIVNHDIIETSGKILALCPRFRGLLQIHSTASRRALPMAFAKRLLEANDRSTWIGTFVGLA
jgi:hypothetical protein